MAAAPPLGPFDHPIALAPAPLQLANFPHSVYGISYDLSTRPIEDRPPNGWGAFRATIYRRVCKFLHDCGYTHEQYSVFQKQQSAMNAWSEMLALRETEPRGIFASVLRRLQLFQIRADFCIVTDDVRLGGQFSPIPIGPTPAGLVPPGMGTPVPAAQWPPFGHLPSGVIPGNDAMDPLNWIY
ncbi:hypothetical protein PLICRDRAFT_27942 [Plicaturopsis crispa FD-325 SS-3]|nr:hypothetical protein PLICRDRAFT_27942 [Plicaturopsis crispa FD-325 SS-3]